MHWYPRHSLTIALTSLVHFLTRFPSLWRQSEGKLINYVSGCGGGGYSPCPCVCVSVSMPHSDGYVCTEQEGTTACPPSSICLRTPAPHPALFLHLPSSHPITAQRHESQPSRRILFTNHTTAFAF
ncbi:hypothetical protein E2C01_076543 [Portunus trituberculatus]|uniref:Secreted protein n=1 Tax=Portunus trituberculatus TaxID=210409 RepID=A0A5B7INV4_PORTR|nr:hypothetical protein [Portunus trituberculatus]